MRFLRTTRSRHRNTLGSMCNKNGVQSRTLYYRVLDTTVKAWESSVSITIDCFAENTTLLTTLSLTYPTDLPFGSSVQAVVEWAQAALLKRDTCIKDLQLYSVDDYIGGSVHPGKDALVQNAEDVPVTHFCVAPVPPLVPKVDQKLQKLVCNPQATVRAQTMREMARFSARCFHFEGYPTCCITLDLPSPTWLSARSPFTFGDIPVTIGLPPVTLGYTSITCGPPLAPVVTLGYMPLMLPLPSFELTPHHAMVQSEGWWGWYTYDIQYPGLSD